MLLFDFPKFVSVIMLNNPSMAIVGMLVTVSADGVASCQYSPELIEPVLGVSHYRLMFVNGIFLYFQ